MAKVIMLTTISRKTVPISRRMTNVITVRSAGARPGSYSRTGTSSLTFSLIYSHYFTIYFTTSATSATVTPTTA